MVSIVRQHARQVPTPEGDRRSKPIVDRAHDARTPDLNAVFASTRKLDTPAASNTSRRASDAATVVSVMRWRAQVRPMARAVVVGAGPTGLGAAIKLTQLGLKVTVIERRDPESPSLELNLNVRPALLDRLDDLGVLKSFLKRSAPTDAIIRHGAPGHDTTEQPPLARDPDGTRTVTWPAPMLNEHGAAVIRIADLNAILYQEAKRVGVEFVPFSDAIVTPHAGDDGKVRYQVEAQSHDAAGAVQGTRRDFGVADLVVVADGANSSTRKQLGIEVEIDPRHGEYIAGSVEGIVPGGHDGAVVQYGVEQDPAESRILRDEVLSNPVTGRSWVVVAAKDAVAKAKPEELKSYFAARAARYMPGLSAADIKFGGDRVFSSRPTRASHVTAGDNLVLIGDAAHTGHFLTSAGAHLGLLTDLGALAQLVTEAKEGTLAWDKAQRLFALRVNQGAATAYAMSNEFMVA